MSAAFAVTLWYAPEPTLNLTVPRLAAFGAAEPPVPADVSAPQ